MQSRKDSGHEYGGVAETRISVPDEHAAIITSRGHCAVSRAHKGHVFYGLPADVATVSHHVPLHVTRCRHNCMCKTTCKGLILSHQQGCPSDEFPSVRDDRTRRMPYLAMLRGCRCTELLAVNDCSSHFQNPGCLSRPLLSCPCTHQDFNPSRTESAAQAQGSMHIGTPLIAAPAPTSPLLRFCVH